MGFAWAEVITANVTKIKTTHVTELQTNIDTDRASVGLGGYAWQVSPTPSVTTIEPTRYTDMMTALDEAYDANTCSVHNVDHHTNYDGTDRTPYEGTHDFTYNLNHHPNDNPGNNGIV